jgi:tRNA-dihydrouridine synthase
MDGVTDAAFRWMIATYGSPDVIFTEFTSVIDVCRGPEFLLSTFRFDERERPIVAQIYGKDPALFYQAAHVVGALGFDGLDINMGCPSKNVAASGSGAGLIRTPDLAHELMRAARQGLRDWAGGQSLEAVGLKSSRADLIRRMNVARGGEPDPVRRELPLSVKTRLGYDSVIIESWAEHLLEEHPAALTVHGRTLEQMYRGQADWEAISRVARLTRGTSTRLLGNGDVMTVSDAFEKIERWGVDGVLIGRGTLGHPGWFDHRAASRPAEAQVPVEAGNRPGPRAVTPMVAKIDHQFRLMMDHARRFEEVFDSKVFPRMRKHLAWYCKGFPLAAKLRAEMMRVCNAADVERLIAAYWAGYVEPEAQSHSPSHAHAHAHAQAEAEATSSIQDNPHIASLTCGSF